MDKVKEYGCLTLIGLFFITLLCAIFGDYDDDLGIGYKYSHDCHHILGPIDIPSIIIEFSYDDNYIVAAQKYKGGSPIDMYYLGNYDNVSFKEYDRDEDGVVYWIVNKNTNQNILCGDRQEFIWVCDSIGVTADLAADISY